jgi:hypothetical protein
MARILVLYASLNTQEEAEGPIQGNDVLNPSRWFKTLIYVCLSNGEDTSFSRYL